MNNSFESGSNGDKAENPDAFENFKTNSKLFSDSNLGTSNKDYFAAMNSIPDTSRDKLPGC